jgi:hypothetical protein
MDRKQQGMTLIGMLITAAFVGLFVLAGIRLAPVYIEYLAVSKALDSAQSELGGTAPTPQDIRKLISRRFDVDNVTSIAAKDIEITRLSQGYKVEADYEGRATYIANLSLVAKFNKAVEIAR